MTDRRYSDDEISAIFAKAAEAPQQSALREPSNEGLTLAELQKIGSEAGISPTAIAHAARALEAGAPAAPRRLLGLPIGVERTIALNRRVSDEEWEHIVVRLREVFDARGTVREHGNFRQWTNGNLQALLEPTPTGHRLRLRTTKASARAYISVGLVTTGMGAFVALSAAMAGRLAAATPGIALMTLMGAGMMAVNALSLPGWARLRGRQMDAIAGELAAGEDSDPPSS
jgi:hypothetical protein